MSVDNIIKNSIDDILREKYLSYAVSTIISRSLPDVRDGLKPVHRRIIFSMYQLRLFHGSPFKKSARIVGDVMGKFHPHGDQAIYDSLVRLTQNFSIRIPLIEGQGNFGNIDGDNAAAMRYTEARLKKISNYFFDGLEEKAVTYKYNYDGQNLEPVVLPAELPNILMNGASGIAVGMATNIPPHNLKELNQAIIKLIDNPSITLTSLLKDFKGPDFPTGGEVVLNNNDKNEIYRVGKGNFIIRSKWRIEKIKNGIYQIVITEIPYQVNKTKLIEQLADLINLKKIPLDDIWDESDENIRIILKPINRNINSVKLIELCFKLTDLSIRYSCNFNVLENGISPKQMGLIEILNNFIDHRREVVKKKSIYKKEKILERLEILSGFLIVYKFLNQIIKIIRTKENPKKEIIKKFKLSILQTEAILNMRLGTLKKLDEINTKKEIKNLKIDLNILNDLIKNKLSLNKFISNNLQKIINEIDETITERKTIILSENKELETKINLTEFQKIEKMTIAVNTDDSIKIYKDFVSYKTIKSNVKKIKNINYFLSNQKLLIFVSSGRVYTIDPSILPRGKVNAKNFAFFVDSNINEKLVGIIPYSNKLNCIVASKFGKGFIADLSKIITNQKKGKQLFNLKSGDQVISVIKTIKKYIACVSTNKKMLIFNTNELPTLTKSGGVVLQKTKNDYFLSDIQTFDLNNGLVWKIGSQLRNEKAVDFWIGKRSQVGKKVPIRFNINLKFFNE